MKASRPLLLIVDDDELLATKVAELLRMDGYQTIVANDGFGALRMIDAGVRPDLILLDMHMDGVSGWDVASELKVSGLGIPVVVATGDPHPEQCAQQITAHGWLGKPFGANELLSAVERVLRAEPGSSQLSSVQN